MHWARWAGCERECGAAPWGPHVGGVGGRTVEPRGPRLSCGSGMLSVAEHGMDYTMGMGVEAVTSAQHAECCRTGN